MDEHGSRTSGALGRRSAARASPSGRTDLRLRVREVGTPPGGHDVSMQSKGLRNSCFVSMHSKGVAAEFFVCMHFKGLSSGMECSDWCGAMHSYYPARIVTESICKSKRYSSKKERREFMAWLSTASGCRRRVPMEGDTESVFRWVGMQTTHLRMSREFRFGSGARERYPGPGRTRLGR